MHQRPIGDLIDALRPICDGEVFSESPGGCPPVRIDTQGWRGDVIKVAGNVSSQFLSGLMMASPIAGKRIRIEVLGELVSRPYVEMTAAIMRDFGVTCRWTDPKEQGQSLSAASPKFEIDSGDGYISRDYEIEPDASAASYFWAAAAITGGEVTVMGLSDQALQGDVRFVDCLELMGCQVRRETDRITVKGSPVLRGIDIDMNAISDTVQTLSVVAMFADGPTTVRGVAHNRFKETDRIGDLAKELRKLGGQITETEDGLIIRPGILRPARIETYEDHRMAMSLALAGLRAPGVQISNPSCTGKTYPDYFADLEALTGRPHHWFA
jgi:3-phosphoshikimate 1-carboxyvinyltransferase